MDLDAIRADFNRRWAEASAQIEADYASLTPAQRKAPMPYRRSARISEIRRSYDSRFRLPHQIRQITLARLGYSREDARSGPLGDLARAGDVGILSDRMRFPSAVYRHPLTTSR